MTLFKMSSIALIAAALAAPALAATDHLKKDDSEMMAIAAVKVTATDALTGVLKQAKGTVAELKLDMFSGKPGYMVTLIDAGGAETNYLVDGVSGAVQASTDSDHE